MSLSFEQQAEFVSESWERISDKSSGMDIASLEKGSVRINGSEPISNRRLVQVIDRPVLAFSEMIENEEGGNGQKPILFAKIGDTGLVAVSKNFSVKPKGPELKIISALVAERAPVEIGKIEQDNTALTITGKTIENATGVEDETIGNPHILIGFKDQLTAIYDGYDQQTEIAAANGNILFERQR